jgi:hypothetical protein
MTQLPQRGHPRDGAPLSYADRFEPAAAAIGPACLDLDERHERAAACYEIDLVAAEPKSMCLDDPPSRHQMGEHDLLSPDTEALAWVFPLFDRYDVTSSRHGGRVRRGNQHLSPISREKGLLN